MVSTKQTQKIIQCYAFFIERRPNIESHRLTESPKSDSILCGAIQFYNSSFSFNLPQPTNKIANTCIILCAFCSMKKPKRLLWYIFRILVTLSRRSRRSLCTYIIKILLLLFTVHFFFFFFFNFHCMHYDKPERKSR